MCESFKVRKKRKCWAKKFNYSLEHCNKEERTYQTAREPCSHIVSCKFVFAWTPTSAWLCTIYLQVVFDFVWTSRATSALSGGYADMLLYLDIWGSFTQTHAWTRSCHKKQWLFCHLWYVLVKGWDVYNTELAFLLF